MKALLKENHQVSIQDIEKPVLKSADDVLIKVVLSGICRTDIYVAEDIIKTTDRRKLVLGHEFSGIVEACGANVTDLNIGDRVCVFPFICPDYAQKEDFLNAQMLGLHTDGSFADYAVTPRKTVFKLPDNVSFKLGAYMEPICASMAVLNADITLDQKGMIFGDNRISKLTLRILEAKGFNNIDVIDAQTDDVKIAENTYDFIIETQATTQTFAKMVHWINLGGTIILKSRQHIPVEISVNDLVQKSITLKAVSYGDFQDAINLAASGKLDVDDLLGTVYPLDAYESAFKESQAAEAKKLFLTTLQDIQAIEDR